MSRVKYHLDKKNIDKAMNAEIPDVLHWLFVFGFKMGLLLLIKNLILLSYDWKVLSPFGLWLIISQIALAIELLWLGLSMDRIRRIPLQIILWLPSVITGIIWRTGSFPYYAHATDSNFFKKLLNSVVVKISNIGGSIFFADAGIWAAFGVAVNVILILFVFSRRNATRRSIAKVNSN